MSLQTNCITVQDITRKKWFTFLNSQWDNSPQVLQGSLIYVAFQATNDSQKSGDTNCHLELWQDGAKVQAKTFTTAQGSGLGLEWTGLMSNSSLSMFTCVSWTDQTVTNKFDFAVVGIPNGGNTSSGNNASSNQTTSQNDAATSTSTGTAALTLNTKFAGIPVFAWLIIAAAAAAAVLLLLWSLRK